MKKSINLYFILSFSLLLLFSCTKDDNTAITPPQDTLKQLTIFHINDQHGRLENFSKIKYIIDQEKQETNVLVTCGGDIFSGNPVVDNYEEKGFPMIDLMNLVGFDISAIGNHEFDYGENILKNRLTQANFNWVCANVNMNSTGIPAPFEYKTITKNDVKVTFLGLVETNGKENAVIPSTHPWRVQNLTFQKYTDVVVSYQNIKEEENSDLYIALTHLGISSDKNLATKFPYFDLIIGGHSHSINNEVTNNIPIFQAGSNLNYLGKIKLTIKNKLIESLNYELIDLEKFNNLDNSIKQVIDTYIENANLSEVIGYAEAYHTRTAVGSFYTDALRNELNVDISIQNTGGVRNNLDEGDILKSEIYSIDPFNNGSVTYTMTVGEIKDFLKETKVAIYYAGVDIEQENGIITIIKNGLELSDNQTLTIGLNDYIPAVYDSYFTQTPTIKPYTTAETIINYLENNTAPINYSQMNNYFKFQ
ncbi:5'-nucleotidase [Lutibacter agarilyticus]|uniref:5'-nucleotidase n=1 Tax=Lutibacter agarilyticus TaxID=1109740 RepID=A0A238YQ96_9FLAO|nr:bifunctional UDP-sugar hydrolase/5'-nucleotidase [Lutibacter agarilyticus]SNR73152.1 5'-nucleotidase [Lutibacter agarilyticus]